MDVLLHSFDCKEQRPKRAEMQQRLLKRPSWKCEGTEPEHTCATSPGSGGWRLVCAESSCRGHQLCWVLILCVCSDTTRHPPRPSSPASQPRGSLSAASRTLVISLPCLLLAGISFLGCLAQILNNRICCGLSPSLLSALRSLGRCQPVVLVIRDFVEEGVVADGALWFSWQRFAAISTHKSVSLAGRRGQQTGWHVWYNA